MRFTTKRSAHWVCFLFVIAAIMTDRASSARVASGHHQFSAADATATAAAVASADNRGRRQPNGAEAVCPLPTAVGFVDHEVQRQKPSADP